MFTVHNVEYCTCAGLSEPSLAAYVRPLVKSVYQKKKKKNTFLILKPKHMLWVLKRTVSMRRFF